jgi:hypothetical protein
LMRLLIPNWLGLNSLHDFLLKPCQTTDVMRRLERCV